MKRKVKYEYVGIHEQASFKYASYKVGIEDVIPLHQHQEWEISLIERGYGTVIMGDSAENFSAGTLTIIPPMIPHCWIFTRTGKKENDITENKTIHFKGSLLEYIGSFKEFEKSINIIKCMDKAITLDKSDAYDINELLRLIKEQEPVDRLFSLIKIICKYASIISNTDIMSRQVSTQKTGDEERIGKVIKYVTKNYMNRITLDEIAGVASMSKTRFCAYFKQTQRQTFFTFLHQYRIQRAVSMLMENKFSVSDICFEVGFNDVPHFIRTFKKYKGCSPRAYINKINVQ